MEHSIQDHDSCAILEQTKPIDSQTDSSMAAAIAAATESKPSFPWLDMIHAKLQYLAQAATKAVRAEDFSYGKLASPVLDHTLDIIIDLALVG